jgi:hypothetical protein
MKLNEVIMSRDNLVGWAPTILRALLFYGDTKLDRKIAHRIVGIDSIRNIQNSHKAGPLKYRGCLGGV